MLQQNKNAEKNTFGVFQFMMCQYKHSTINLFMIPRLTEIAFTHSSTKLSLSFRNINWHNDFLRLILLITRPITLKDCYY